MLMRLQAKKMTKEQFMAYQLEKAIKKSSKGMIPKNIRTDLARRTVDKLDFSNPYQMHKSPQGYADIIVENYFRRNPNAKRKRGVAIW